MSGNAEILNELKEISPLLSQMDKVNPYIVPSGYFEELENTFLSQLPVDDKLSIVQDITIPNPMQVPEGYFDLLADSILHRIKAGQNEETPSGELKNISSLLHTIDRTNVFSVPEGYFDNLANEILTKTVSKEAKIISFKGTKTTKWLRYAAAAMVVGVIGLLATFLITRKEQNVKGFDATVKTGILYFKQNKFDEELNKTSDEAIANYLQKNLDDADALQMIANLDYSQLPNEEELFSNETLIDELVNELENKTSNNN
ncbi:MAG TPA: hypothetical protein VFN30_03570 [Chitinophagaceae bacterium]|nr:hypothetical protein [Chitinophagaceae bacterium]